MQLKPFGSMAHLRDFGLHSKELFLVILGEGVGTILFLSLGDDGNELF
jgi:hypothetical protein